MIWLLVALLMLDNSAEIQLPASPCPGWTSYKQRIVLPSDIFDYMNGAGELYLGYSFKKLYVREYNKKGQPSLLCELYELPSSADAYGLFSQDRTGEPIDIGQEAIYASGLLLAWHGRYFLRILADRETPESKLCSIKLARLVMKLCGPPGEKPSALEWLPKGGLDEKSVKYFHTHSCLNYFHFLSTQNILGLSTSTEAVMGRYITDKGKSLVLVVGYPNENDARSAWNQFCSSYIPGSTWLGRYALDVLEDKTWVGIARVRNRLLIVLESPSKQECMTLLERLVVCNSKKGEAGNDK